MYFLAIRCLLDPTHTCLQHGRLVIAFTLHRCGQPRTTWIIWIWSQHTHIPSPFAGGVKINYYVLPTWARVWSAWWTIVTWPHLWGSTLLTRYSQCLKLEEDEEELATFIKLSRYDKCMYWLAGIVVWQKSSAESMRVCMDSLRQIQASLAAHGKGKAS